VILFYQIKNVFIYVSGHVQKATFDI